MADKPTCFVMMPISTPETYAIALKNPNHFTDILKYLHTPAIEKAGYEVVSPLSSGSELIHADIIQNISNCDLVLCDMSSLNPNVFFEFGIRCALNKPVALIVDDITGKIPFDTGLINHHEYKCVPGYKANEEMEKITKHIEESIKKSKNQNTLWKHFGITQTGSFNPDNSSDGDKLDYLISQFDRLDSIAKLDARKTFYFGGSEYTNDDKNRFLENEKSMRLVDKDEISQSQYICENLERNYTYEELRNLKSLDRSDLLFDVSHRMHIPFIEVKSDLVYTVIVNYIDEIIRKRRNSFVKG